MAGFGDELILFRGPSGTTNLGSLGGSATYNGGMGVVSDTDSGGVSAFEFASASSQYMSLAAGTDITEGSFGFWFKSSTAARQVIYEEYTDASNYTTVQFGDNLTGTYADESMVYALASAGAAKRLVYTRDGTNAYQSGSWVHLVLTVDNTARKIYVNGTLKTVYEPSGTTSGFFTNNGTDATISFGRRVLTTPAFYLDGRLDDMRVTPTVLNGTQVSAWYSAGRGYDVTSGASPLLFDERMHSGGFSAMYGGVH